MVRQVGHGGEWRGGGRDPMSLLRTLLPGRRPEPVDVRVAPVTLREPDRVGIDGRGDFKRQFPDVYKVCMTSAQTTKQTGQHYDR